MWMSWNNQEKSIEKHWNGFLTVNTEICLNLFNFIEWMDNLMNGF